jgi:ubiquinone/menaquinone biosynthesis C-methylase UbiE
MSDSSISQNILQNIFLDEVVIHDNLIQLSSISENKNQQQTNEMFSDKWTKVDEMESVSKMEATQLQWYLSLYGFTDESTLSEFLKSKKIIIDAGCGLGYKASWFARLAPESIVLGIDYSEAALIAARRYSNQKNLFFVRGDIANTGIKANSIDYISCDQVIHHTEDPEQTFAHLASLLSKGGELACYVYAKKAVPRELLDDYFRTEVHNYSKEELWEFSKQMTQLGKILTDLKITIEVPEMPLLRIKGGQMDLQRFIYWNFIKCFWREDWGSELCDSTNFDWYSPSNAARYTREEFDKWSHDNNLSIAFAHSEEACHTGRFKK